MHLRELRLRNFRSCADTTVRFDDLLTVLVGENDAGKTNVVEAIRLVTAPSDGRRTRYVGLDDVRLNANGLELSTTYSGLDDTQRGLFFSALPSNRATEATWTYRWELPSGVERRRAPRWTVGPKGLPEQEPEVRDFIRHVHLPALRDADRDLASSSPGRIEFLLRQLLLNDEAAREELLACARDASDQLLAQPPLVRARDSVRTTLKPLVAGFREPEAHLRFAEPTLVGLARDLRFSLTQHGIDPSKLARTGLGYANLLYLASVLVELDAADDAELTLLLVEEPEAHLHPQLQNAVLTWLRERAEQTAKRTPAPGAHAGRIQVVVTTHSPNLTAAMSIKHVVVLRPVEPNKASPTSDVAVAEGQGGPDAKPRPDGAPSDASEPSAPVVGAEPSDGSAAPVADPSTLVAAESATTAAIAIAELGLHEATRRKIDRYLDVTKASLLFSTRVLLVEGIAEALLIPAFARCVLDQHESDRLRAATILPIEGVDFEPYVRLLLASTSAAKARIADKVVVLTDEDPTKASNEDEPGDEASDGEGQDDASDGEAAAGEVGVTEADATPVSAKPSTAPRPAGQRRAEALHRLAKKLGADECLHVAVTPCTLEVSLLSDPDPAKAAEASAVLRRAFAACVTRGNRRFDKWPDRIDALPTTDRGAALLQWMKETKTRKGDFAQMLAMQIEDDWKAEKRFPVPQHIADALRSLVAP